MDSTWATVGTQPAPITLNGFDSALDVWLRRPHLANKRLRHGTMLYSYGCKKECVEEVVEALRKDPHQQPLLTENLNNVDDKAKSYDVIIHVRQLTSRLDTPPLLEAVCIDPSNHSATFWPLPIITAEKLPFFYPNLTAYRLAYEKKGEEEATITVQVIGSDDTSGQWVAEKLAVKLMRWGQMYDSGESKAPRVNIVDLDRFSKVYLRLKKLYGMYLVENWPECTDPQKYVFEDVSIAAYLICLWEQCGAPDTPNKKPSFIDLGCGNGVLVWILNKEGYKGKGVDVRARKIWDLFGDEATLEVHTVQPNETTSYKGYDWLIGNHSDELTPWIPILAANGKCNYFVLPCCFFDLYGKFSRKSGNGSQYIEYLNYIKTVGESCGYSVDVDSLRIPSTKRVCQIGQWKDQDTRAQILELIDQRKKENVDDFQARKAVIVVRNCTRLDKGILSSVVQRVMNALVEQCPPMKWRCGTSLPLKSLVELLGADTMQHLKNECGGLQTLLRNHNQLFLVRGGHVQMRDWRMDADPSNAIRPTKPTGKPDIAYKSAKTKPCLFIAHHPDGCPRSANECSFAHDTIELRPSGPRPSPY